MSAVHTLLTTIRKEGRSEFVHGEAFMRMRYQCDANPRHWEIVWNSRDGVTPFIIDCRVCKEQASHVNWSGDERDVAYVPEIGTRVFIDLSREAAEEAARKRVVEYWHHPTYPMSKSFETPEQARFALATRYLDSVGAPTVVEVDEFWHAVFKRRADMYRIAHEVRT